MKIELDLTPKEIEQFRQMLDEAPGHGRWTLITKVLIALPLDEVPPELHTEGVTIQAAQPATFAEASACVLGTEMRITALTEKGKEFLPTLLANLTGTKQ